MLCRYLDVNDVFVQVVFVVMMLFSVLAVGAVLFFRSVAIE